MRMSSTVLSRWMLLLVLLVVTGVLFWGDPGIDLGRSFRHLWNAGHLVYFGLLSYLLLTLKIVKRRSITLQWLITLGLTMAGGVLIELMQIGTTRTADMQDVLRDLIGSLLVLSWVTGRGQTGVFRRVIIGVRAGLIIALLIMLKPLAVSLIDEGIALYQFPVLADFNNPFAIKRWEGNAERTIVSLPAMPETRAMQIDLTRQKYSGVFLRYFPGDWRGYDSLIMTLYNPGDEVLMITCRIHDEAHELSRQSFSDRFNRTYGLRPGLNRLRIGLDTVAAAPAGRTMDLGHIHSLGLFTTKLVLPRLLYLLDVRLE